MSDSVTQTSAQTKAPPAAAAAPSSSVRDVLQALITVALAVVFIVKGMFWFASTQPFKSPPIHLALQFGGLLLILAIHSANAVVESAFRLLARKKARATGD